MNAEGTKSVETARLSKLASQKKAYASPKLETYGNLRSITEHTGNHPHPDSQPYPSPTGFYFT
jgi:hypothetical protein